jgi:hypothetical protein
MRKAPIFTSWSLTCPSPDRAQAVRNWLGDRIRLDRVVTDSVRTFPKGEPHSQEEHHRLGAYFAAIECLPDNGASFRLVFQRRPEATRFWKDLMVNILQEIDSVQEGVSVSLDYKGDEHPGKMPASTR